MCRARKWENVKGIQRQPVFTAEKNGRSEEETKTSGDSGRQAQVLANIQFYS